MKEYNLVSEKVNANLDTLLPTWCQGNLYVERTSIQQILPEG